ncbi:MAG: hypothetical protein IMZ66_09325 [Planctomycetes bacterium]|nr:hypothetical protein [Planctomycetota bacterium]
MAKQALPFGDIIRGLDGLIMLGEWQVMLARDLRDKAQAATARQGGDLVPPDENREST